MAEEDQNYERRKMTTIQIAEEAVEELENERLNEEEREATQKRTTLIIR